MNYMSRFWNTVQLSSFMILCYNSLSLFILIHIHIGVQHCMYETGKTRWVRSVLISNIHTLTYSLYPKTRIFPAIETREMLWKWFCDIIWPNTKYPLDALFTYIHCLCCGDRKKTAAWLKLDVPAMWLDWIWISMSFSLLSRLSLWAGRGWIKASYI